MEPPEQQSTIQEPRERDDDWADPERRWKLANEAWLQAHWKAVLAVILVLAFCLFILPWAFLPFLPALAIQIFGAAGFYLAARRYTTAFNRDR